MGHNIRKCSKQLNREGVKKYEEMKYKQVLKYILFELNNIKEDYLIAKGGKANAYTLMRYLET